MAVFKVLKLPHLGLNLSVGKSYTAKELEKRCKGDKKRLSELREKLKDPSIFGASGAMVPSKKVHFVPQRDCFRFIFPGIWRKARKETRGKYMQVAVNLAGSRLAAQRVAQACYARAIAGASWVKLALAKGDLEDARAKLSDEQFLMMLKEECQMTDQECEERQRMRQLGSGCKRCQRRWPS